MIRFFLLFVTLLAYAPLTYAQPLQVFLLAGQSNMQGHAQVRTFEHIGMDPATKPMLDEMLSADGSPRVLDRVWISSVGCADHEQTGKLNVHLVEELYSASLAVKIP
jgi:alpha-galactosidase